MLKKLFLLCLFAATNKCCELPEHLKTKEFITIRTPDGKIGNFKSERVQYSGLLCDLAFRPNSDSMLDIDLISDKEKLLTYEKLDAILNLIGFTGVMTQWAKMHSIDLTNPFECISLVDTIKYLNLEDDQKIADTFISATMCGEHQLFATNSFQKALIRYFKGENISLANAQCYEEFCVIAPPAREIDLNNIQAPPKSISWKPVVFNNYSPSVTFDIKKESPIKDITIINQPHTSLPSIQLKNVSGYDGLSLTLKHEDVTPEEHQQFHSMLWPPWYKPAAIITSLKYGCLQTLVIGGSLTLLAMSLVLNPALKVSDYLDKNYWNKKSKFLDISLAVIGIPIFTIFILDDDLISPLRSKVYKHYTSQNELNINGRKEKFSSYFHILAIRLHQKFTFINKFA